MDRVHYAGTSIVTGTAVAHALLDYAQALGQIGASATVKIPTLNEDGSRGRSEILIGPSSQLISDEWDSDHDEVLDEDLVIRMHAEAVRLRNYGVSAPMASVPSMDTPRDQSGYDF